MHNSALFLDRDGVINVDRGYIHRSDQFEFVLMLGDSMLKLGLATVRSSRRAAVWARLMVSCEQMIVLYHTAITVGPHHPRPPT